MCADGDATIAATVHRNQSLTNDVGFGWPAVGAAGTSMHVGLPMPELPEAAIADEEADEEDGVGAFR